MAEALKPGCKRPTGGPTENMASEVSQQDTVSPKEEKKMIMVGQKAPDFTAPGYLNGQFVEGTLSEYFGDGKWALLCFYPGDFTFV
jgi:peroxiredoxin (alkyl hydroperoxide reductase subunit C)